MSICPFSLNSNGGPILSILFPSFHRDAIPVLPYAHNSRLQGLVPPNLLLHWDNKLISKRPGRRDSPKETLYLADNVIPNGGRHRKDTEPKGFNPLKHQFKQLKAYRIREGFCIPTVYVTPQFIEQRRVMNHLHAFRHDWNSEVAERIVSSS